MTTGKRALIVDDSRSARIILSRMLEQNGMTVDTAESAEQALEYLQRSRPDVIFMDHLMPGMDGFQAVQVIKSDPLTATIPLMMYTSQEGELYVSQARALGAVGVLPKTVRPVDVSRILYQLHLLPDRRTRRTALFEGPAAAAAAAAEIAPGEAAMAAALAPPVSRWHCQAWKRGTGRLAARHDPERLPWLRHRRPRSSFGHGPLSHRSGRTAGRIAAIDAAARHRISWPSSDASCWRRSKLLHAG
jgi:CheY-like chemotaxis protein